MLSTIPFSIFGSNVRVNLHGVFAVVVMFYPGTVDGEPDYFFGGTDDA